jgi:DNA-binding HxlR family transcriptional regulator
LRHATLNGKVVEVKRSSFEDMNCAIAQSLEIIGEWWTLLILRDAFFGVTRFEEWHERLGIARNILTARLDTLVEHGVMERRPYDEARGRYDYVLTNKGRALWPVMVTLRQWGDEWVLGLGNEPIALIHQSCGEVSHGQLVCDHCGEPLESDQIRSARGPGLKDPDFLLRPRSH